MENVWEKLRQKLDGMTKGYPKTENGAELVFLKKIFTEEDAEFFIRFKSGLQTVEAVAEHYGMLPEEAEARLEDMSKKHLMYWERNGLSKKYRIVPYIHGLWEFNVDKHRRHRRQEHGGNALCERVCEVVHGLSAPDVASGAHPAQIS